MERIASFQVNHDTLEPGVYVSRIDGDITTYDMRFIKPNTPPFLPNPVMHTIEHLFATYSRNSKYADKVIYFGPMGCRTGFYFLVRDMSQEDALELIKDTVLNVRITQAKFQEILPQSAEITRNTTLTVLLRH